MSKKPTGAKRRWEDAERDVKDGKRAPLQDAKGKFAKGNPGGGTHKRRSPPMDYEQFVAKEPAFWAALYDQAIVEKKITAIRLGLAYLAGPPAQTVVHERRVSLEVLSLEQLKKLLTAVRQVKELEAGETLTLPPGEILEGVAVEIKDVQAP